MRWDFYGADYLAHGYDLFTGVYLGYQQQTLYELTRDRIPDHESYLFSLDGFAGGPSEDTNADGVPDECDVTPGDMNGDGLVTAKDVGAFVACLTGPDVPRAPGCAAADIDLSGTVDLADASAFCRLYGGP